MYGRFGAQFRGDHSVAGNSGSRASTRIFAMRLASISTTVRRRPSNSTDSPGSGSVPAAPEQILRGSPLRHRAAGSSASAFPGRAGSRCHPSVQFRRRWSAPDAMRVEFIFHFPCQLFDRVLCRHQPHRRSVLIYRDGQMPPVLLKIAEQVEGRLRFRHHEHVVHDLHKTQSALRGNRRCS